MNKKIYLVRHTTPSIKPGLCYGRADLDVTDSFGSEAESVKENIDFPSNYKFFSSPLTRCKKLADFLSPDNKICVSSSLIEMNFGEWEMQLWDLIPTHQTDAFFTDFVNTPPPGGESFSDVKNRVEKFWLSEIENLTTDSIIVTHAGVIRTILSFLLEIPLKNSFSIDFGYSSVILCTQVRKKLYNIKFLKT